MPTASAVVADVIDTAVGRTALTFRTLELWSHGKEHVDGNDRGVSDYANVSGRFYLRVMVLDHPGVLAQVMTVLGAQNISIASVLQQEVVGAHSEAYDTDQGADVVPLVIMTHVTTEGAVSEACQVINRLDAVQQETVRMWVRD
jgi:homoserine dehydrogenase